MCGAHQFTLRDNLTPYRLLPLEDALSNLSQSAPYEVFEISTGPSFAGGENFRLNAYAPVERYKAMMGKEKLSSEEYLLSVPVPETMKLDIFPGVCQVEKRDRQTVYR